MRTLIVLAVAGCLAASALWGGRLQEAQEEQPPKYVGAQTCRNCHRAEEKGNQFALWEASRHAKAYETLATDRARELGAGRNVENPQQADECLRCHVIGVGLPAERLHRSFRREQGVQCESCHGAGERHVRNRMANAQETGQARGSLNAEISMATEQTCRGCHNEESPAYQEFNFRERVREIRHLDPTRGPLPDEEPEDCPEDPR